MLTLSTKPLHRVLTLLLVTSSCYALAAPAASAARVDGATNLRSQVKKITPPSGNRLGGAPSHNLSAEYAFLFLSAKDSTGSTASGTAHGVLLGYEYMPGWQFWGLNWGLMMRGGMFTPASISFDSSKRDASLVTANVGVVTRLMLSNSWSAVLGSGVSYSKLSNTDKNTAGDMTKGTNEVVNPALAAGFEWRLGQSFLMDIKYNFMSTDSSAISLGFNWRL